MNFLWKVVFVIFLLIGGYYWLVSNQIDYAALYFALAALNNSNYIEGEMKSK